MQLDVKRTRAIAQEQLAGPLGVSVEEVCAAIVEVANANMLKMLRIVSVEQGYDPQDFCLIPSGGSGPVHAVELAQELGITEVIVPPAPGLLSSQGLLSADVRYDFRRTFVAFAADADLAVLNTLVGELRVLYRNMRCPLAKPKSSSPRICAISVRLTKSMSRSLRENWERANVQR
jgi:N-methylhydantoinase A